MSARQPCDGGCWSWEATGVHDEGCRFAPPRAATPLDDAETTEAMLAAEVERLTARAERAEAEVARLATLKDGAYAERDRCVALVARMAAVLHWPTWLGQHVGAEWDEDWRNIVFVELPSGQVSWHIHDSDVPLVAFLAHHDEPWDGHDTAEKYRRCEAPWPWPTPADSGARP